MDKSKQANLSQTIIKTMGMYGSIQVFNILCSIIRTKLIALWIGPVGMGLFAIFNSAIDMIGNISNLGLRTSSIRNISQETNNGSALNNICTAVRRWSLVLGIIGAIAIAALSPLLSQMSFGDKNHIWGYIALSIAVLANTLTNGEHSILQGTSLLRKLAKASLYGAFTGLLLSIPLFYFLGENSIIPSIICYSLSILLFSYLLRNKDVGIRGETLSVKDTINLGKDFLKLGIFITLTDIASQITNYAFISYLNNASSTEMVGYYQTGYTLIAKYTALIFSSLGVEYFPRLSKVSHSNIRLNTFVSQEINIVLMILTPVIIAFILCRRLIISILYSPDFFIIETFISVGIIGMIFRAISWCMAFVILAKGKGKIFFITEIISTITFLLIYIPAFKFFGLNGFGLAFLLWYVLYAIIIAFVYYRLFKLRLSVSCYKWLIWALLTSSTALLLTETGNTIATILILIVATVYSAIKFKKIFNH